MSLADVYNFLAAAVPSDYLMLPLSRKTSFCRIIHCWFKTEVSKLRCARVPGPPQMARGGTFIENSKVFMILRV